MPTCNYLLCRRLDTDGLICRQAISIHDYFGSGILYTLSRRTRVVGIPVGTGLKKFSVPETVVCTRACMRIVVHMFTVDDNDYYFFSDDRRKNRPLLLTDPCGASPAFSYNDIVSFKSENDRRYWWSKHLIKYGIQKKKGFIDFAGNITPAPSIKNWFSLDERVRTNT